MNHWCYPYGTKVTGRNRVLRRNIFAAFAVKDFVRICRKIKYLTAKDAKDTATVAKKILYL
jgi:hypothetical protein